MRNKITRCVSFTKDTNQWVKMYAEEMGLTINDVITMAVDCLKINVELSRGFNNGK